MNILLWGDLHARLNQGANLKPLVMDLDLSYLSSRLTVILETLKWMENIIKKYDIKKVICNGDIYEHIGVDTFTRNVVYDTLGGIARIVNDNWITITGNHDTSSTSDPFDSILFSHNAYSKIVFGKFKIEYIQPINSVFVYVPYFLKTNQLISIYKSIIQDLKKFPRNTKKFLVAHHNLKELMTHGNSPTIKQLKLEKFTKCFFGHIHYRKSVKNVQSIGAIVTDSFTDSEDINKGVTILKINNSYEEIFIPNPHSPYYVKLTKEDFINDSDKLQKVIQLKNQGRRIYAEFMQVPEDLINTYKHIFDLISISADIDKDTIIISEGEIDSNTLNDWKTYLRDRFIEFLTNDYSEVEKDHKKIIKMFMNYLKKAEEVD